MSLGNKVRFLCREKKKSQGSHKALTITVLCNNSLEKIFEEEILKYIPFLI